MGTDDGPSGDAAMNDDYGSSRDSGLSQTTDPLGAERAPMTPRIETVFEVLADDERRDVCLYLMRLDTNAVCVEDLVEILADRDTDRERLALDLHHRHLPKLADAGIIEYDSRSNTVRYWGQPTVEKWAEHVNAVDHRTGQSAP